MRQLKELRSGAVSASTRRRTTFLLVLLAWLARLWTHRLTVTQLPEAPTSLMEFLTSPAWPWVDAPLPGLVVTLASAFGPAEWMLLAFELIAATIVVVSLLRLGQRWLDFEAAVIGAIAWALGAPLLAIFTMPASAGWTAAIAMMIAGAMLRVAHRRQPENAWKIGALAGLHSLFGGGGLWWVLGAMAWLPLTSPRFRGWGFARSASLIVAGWLVVVMPFAVRNAAVGGGDPKVPGAGDLARVHAAVHTPELSAPRLTIDAGKRGPASVAYTDSVLAASGLPVHGAEWTRGTNLVTLTLQRANDEGGAGWTRMVRRAVATVGGWSPPGIADVTGIPWFMIVLFAWAGVAALLPGMRQLFPLVLGGMVPVVQAMLLGIGSPTLLAASPFVCLYAGYGAWRMWDGRRSPLTWAIAPLALVLAGMLHLWVRDWT